MIARNLISIDFPTFYLGDSITEVREIIGQSTYEEFPVLDNGNYVGYTNEKHLSETKSDTLTSEHCYEPALTVRAEDDYLSVLQLFADKRFTYLPVLRDQLFIGMVTLENCALMLAKTYSSVQAGGALLISVEQKSYSLSHLSRLIESEDAKIIGLWIEKTNAHGELLIYVKVDTEYTDVIESALEAHGYDVIYKSGKAKNHLMQERYEGLMKYLDI